MYIEYWWLGLFLLSVGLFFEQKSKAKKICKKYTDFFSENGKEWQSNISRYTLGEEYRIPDKLIFPGDKVYLVTETDQFIRALPLNGGKVYNMAKRQHQFIMQEFQHDQTIYRVVGSSVLVYHHLEISFDYHVICIRTPWSFWNKIPPS